MKGKIDKMLEYLTQLTKKEADFIQSILQWESDDKIAFFIAKKTFEEDD